jgi:hypothetical protein
MFKDGISFVKNEYLNVLISIILQYVWGLLNDMSFLTILTMVSITIPGIAKYLQAALLNFIYMDLLKTDLWLIPLIFPDDDNNENKDDGPQLTEEEDLVQSAETYDVNSPLNSYFD